MMIRPEYFHKNRPYWQVVLDLAFERERLDGAEALELSDYVAEFAALDSSALADRSREWLGVDCRIEGLRSLTAQQRQSIIEEVVADWLESASRSDLFDVLTRRDRFGLVGFNTPDLELISHWANLGNRQLPEPGTTR